MKNARVVLVCVLDTVASLNEFIRESAGDASCLPGAKFHVLPLGKVPGVGSNNTEEASFLLGVAKVLDGFDVFFWDFHRLNISRVSSGSLRAARKRSASFPGA
jgi:hypothetical protein